MGRRRRLGNYILETKELGHNNFGISVVRGRAPKGQRVVVKIFDTTAIYEDDMSEVLKFEVATMVRTSWHPNVVNLVDILASPTKIFVIQEAVTGENLLGAIESATRFDEYRARPFFRQLVAGVEHCHSRGVFHRDLKLENILLDLKGNAKISGFGFSAHFDPAKLGNEDIKLTTVCGTPEYVAPEVLLEGCYDGAAVDIWSLGVILYAMLEGFLPFDCSNISDLFSTIKNADFKFTKDMSASVRDLLVHILEPDPGKRFSLSQIRGHSWFLGSHTPTLTHDASRASEETYTHKHTTCCFCHVKRCRCALANANMGHKNSLTSAFFVTSKLNIAWSTRSCDSQSDSDGEETFPNLNEGSPSLISLEGDHTRDNSCGSGEGTENLSANCNVLSTANLSEPSGPSQSVGFLETIASKPFPCDLSPSSLVSKESSLPLTEVSVLDLGGVCSGYDKENKLCSSLPLETKRETESSNLLHFYSPLPFKGLSPFLMNKTLSAPRAVVGQGVFGREIAEGSCVRDGDILQRSRIGKVDSNRARDFKVAYSNKLERGEGYPYGTLSCSVFPSFPKPP